MYWFNRFWFTVLLFAYRRILTRGEGEPDGIPGRRDPDAICTGYSPRKQRDGDWDCGGDGHYLCWKCCHLYE